jgi:transcriptional regulator with XRE-family HTH domain
MYTIEARQVLREDFISKNQKEWKERGQLFKERREAKEFPISFVAVELGISPGRLKRFEEGHPIKDSKLIEKAYDLFLNYWNLRRDVSKTLRNYDWGN